MIDPMRIPRHIATFVRLSPDPDRAGAALERLLELVPANVEPFFSPDAERAAARLVKLLATSQAALRYILDDPEALEAVAEGLDSPTIPDVAQAWHLLGDRELSAGERAAEDHVHFRRLLLRFRRREWMRIVAADLADEGSFETYTARYSAVADLCIRNAWSRVGGAEIVGVIALGKLGGQELNYSSDVDLVFASADLSASQESRVETNLGESMVCGARSAQSGTDSADVPGTTTERVSLDEMAFTSSSSAALVKEFMTLLAGEVPADRILLVDPDLRPEGQSGPLVRSVSSYEKYWSTWAEPWEIQSLIKARPVAGPQSILRAFMEKASTYLWPDTLDAEAIKSIRHIKRRSEAHAARTTKTFDIKRSSGGIRDVEMAVQLLQLIHGRHDDSIRCPNTLDAIDALEEGGYISGNDTSLLRESYVFLRRVEHRLQLRNDTARYDLPKDPRSFRVLAKSMGYSDTKAASAEERFDNAFTEVTAKVRELHRRLFFRPLLEAFAALPKSNTSETGRSDVLDIAVAEERLRALGFRDTRRARAGLEELTKGISRKSRLMAQLMPLILEWLSESPDPTTGLVNLRNLVGAVGDQVVLVSTFRENPAAVQRLCKVLGTSKVVADLLIRTPEHIHAFSDDQELLSKKDDTTLVEEARRTASWRSGYREILEGTLRFCNRELVRIATRDLLSNDRSEVEVVAQELCGVSQGAITVLLDAVVSDLGKPQIRFCVIGLGSFGAREMTYSSDIDVMFIYDTDPSATDSEKRDAAGAAHSIATRLLQDLKGLGTPGPGLNLDADLRPEGRAGVLARSLDAAVSYYKNWADTWEFQALAKARPVAGDEQLFRRLMAEVTEQIWPAPFPESRAREIRLMKARVERERGSPQKASRRFDLKLGPGGLTDVQFLVELLSLRYGAEHNELRSGSTLERLRVLAKLGKIPEEDARRLEESYLLCSHIRNRIFLIKGRQSDTIPSRPEETVILAESLGYMGHPRSRLLDDYRRVTRRARTSFERLFYSDD